jgi:hypothetical protein
MPSITSDLFIIPGANLQPENIDYRTAANLSKQELKDRWLNPTGKSILSRWKANGFSRQFLDGLIGKFYDRTDLRGITLSGEDLAGLDLSNIEFYGADLQRAQFKNANLSGSHLSETNIRGTCFDFADMTNVLIDSTSFDNKTSFTGVNLSAVNFTLAVLLQESAIGQQRIANLEKKHPILASFLRITCDYGRSFVRFFSWCLIVIVVFAVLYIIFPGTLTKFSLVPNSPTQVGFWDSLYFSVLSFASANSDVQAVSPFGKILLVIETAIGYLMTGLLVAVLVKRTIGD